jgi:hypothetical protein
MKRAWGIANRWNVDRSLPGDDDVRMSRIVDRLCWEFPEIPRSQLEAMIYGAGATPEETTEDQGPETTAHQPGDC